MDGRCGTRLAIVVYLLCATSAAVADEPVTESPQLAAARDHSFLAKSADIRFREGPSEESPLVDFSLAGMLLHVSQLEGDWLRLEHGWIRAGDLVRDDDAVEFFTAQIKRCESAFAYAARSRAST